MKTGQAGHEGEPVGKMNFLSKKYGKSVNPLTLRVSEKASDLLPESTKENTLTDLQTMWAAAYGIKNLEEGIQ